MDDPFIGSEALSSGWLTRYELRRYYAPIMPNVYVDKRIRPTLEDRTRAAWLWSGREAVVAGLAASALHGAKWVDEDVPIELIWRNARTPEDVITRADLLLPSEFDRSAQPLVTTPERTAFDIGRRGSVGHAVERLDALARATGFKVGDVASLAREHRGARGISQLRGALDLVDAGAESPQETRLRLMLIRKGYPRPRTQIPVPGPNGRPKYFLDMGWEDLMLAVEYDGDHHRTDSIQFARDIERMEYTAGIGWRVVRVAKGNRSASVLRRVQAAWDERSALR
jgi:very-short-patch-repair endonuclease